jgi:hypothetical protein
LEEAAFDYSKNLQPLQAPVVFQDFLAGEQVDVYDARIIVGLLKSNMTTYRQTGHVPLVFSHGKIQDW